MAYAYVNLILKEGDLKFMAKFKATHVSGNFEMLGFIINGDTDIVFSKSTIRKGKKVEYEYWLKFKNPDAEDYLNIELSKKPDNDIVRGWITCSDWHNSRPFSISHFCNIETKRGSIEVVFFKEDGRHGITSKKKAIRFNCLGEPLKDDVEVFDAIKYLKLDATKL